MYRHHEESLKIMEDYFRKRKEVIALIFGGSVAKGMERPDSDLDAMVIVPDAYYETLLEENSRQRIRGTLCLTGNSHHHFCVIEAVCTTERL